MVQQQLLSADEAAKFLNVAHSTLMRWAKQGVVPVSTKGRSYVFKLDELRAWQRTRRIYEKQKPSIAVDNQSRISLAQTVERGGIYYDVPGENKAGVIASAVAELVGNQVIDASMKESVIADIIARDTIASTAVGYGIALPHFTRPHAYKGLEEVAAVFFLHNEIDFQSTDGAPVRIIFMILSSKVKEHLRIISAISRYIHNADNRNFLQSIPQKDALISSMVNY